MKMCGESGRSTELRVSTISPAFVRAHAFSAPLHKYGFTIMGRQSVFNAARLLMHSCARAKIIAPIWARRPQRHSFGAFTVMKRRDRIR
jgi:hypothetical protein